MIVDVSPLWTRNLGSRLKGLRLAREKGWLFAWDKNHVLFLLDHAGHVQAQTRFENSVVAAAIADDGSALAAVDQNGLLRALNPDLSSRWQRPGNVPPLALAMDPLGEFCAYSDTKGSVHIFGREGQMVGQVQTPRPLHHLAFVPAAPLLAGSADYGLVGVLDFQGNWSWRDAPVVHTGSLVVSERASATLLACFSEGLHLYGPHGQKPTRLSLPEPCPSAVMTFTGQLLLAAGMSNTLYFLDQTGKILSQWSADKPVQALALAALGNRVYLVSKEGELSCWRVVTRAGDGVSFSPR